MTYVPSILLLLLFAAIAALLFAKIKGKAIPMAVIFVLGFFAVCMAGIVAFIKNGENYDAYLFQQWQPLQPEKIQGLVEQGYTVVVDVQADWCLPCRANKANVWHREQVVDTLNADNIVLMRGDITNSNPLVEGYLASVGGHGTPYNRVYGPQQPQGIELPATLAITDLLWALSKVN
ncbi:thiol:disulfide interchange protein [Shewanella sp. WXL01]|uniref:Thiol:disulfide interchange protein n=1 Tax=Shewanella maritima TaxID=2520507 RepID=A0A411PFW2_9GAMM|nr:MULTISPECIES: thioredoxin family protein [Shewanella]NKF49626.1 thiol:disulfide interchange protein [Shewanella sp. WXL01]QBF82280.1 thiol:disulfide interchange protein [Shewanella maritima]